MRMTVTRTVRDEPLIEDKAPSLFLHLQERCACLFEFQDLRTFSQLSSVRSSFLSETG